MLRAVEFDFPIGRSNDRFIGNSIRVAAARALLTAHRTRFVRVCVDVNHARHWPDYTADAVELKCWLLMKPLIVENVGHVKRGNDL